MRRAWTLIGFLWLAFFLNYCDRQMVFSIFPALKADLGFTNAQLGLTGAIFLWAYGVSSPLAGVLGDRYSKRLLVVGSLLLWSAATVLTGFSNSPAMLLVSRGLMGLTEALFLPPAIALIGGALPASMQSRAIGVFYTAQLSGVVAGGSIGGWSAERFGWRSAFFALGVVGAVFAGPLALFFRRFPEPAKRLEVPKPSLSILKALARVPSYVSLCVCFPAFTLLLWVVYAWLANFLYERFSLGMASAAFIATAYVQGATAVGVLCGSVFSDWLYKRRKEARFWLLAASMIFGAPWVHLLGHASTLTLAKLGAAGFGLAIGLLMANFMIAPFDVVPFEARSSSIAVINTIGPPFSGLATLYAGVSKDRFGMANLMSFFAVLAFLSGVALLVATHFLFEKDYRRLIS